MIEIFKKEIEKLIEYNMSQGDTCINCSKKYFYLKNRELKQCYKCEINYKKDKKLTN